MLINTVKNRWQAFAIHLLISAVIFMLLLWVILQFWFPGVLVQMGGWGGIKIVAAVDLILGPLLTLFIYDRNKKELKWDLSIIAGIQIVCLIAGMWLVYKERPLVQIFSQDTVYIWGIEDLHQMEIAKEYIDQFPGRYPKQLYIDLPKSMAEITQIEMVYVLSDASPLYARNDLYRIMDSNQAEYQWRYDLLEKDEHLDCRWLPVQNKHFIGQACMQVGGSLLEIKAEEL